MKFNKKFKKVGIIAGVTCIVVLIIGAKYKIPIISTAVNYILYPVQKSIIFVSDQTTGFTHYFKDIQLLITENEILKQENEKLVYENTILAEYKNENNNLKNLLEMKQRYRDYEGVGANVIGKESGNWYKIFNIDKGTNHHVYENSVILANGALAGRVLSATSISSKVLSIIDDRSSVSAKIVRTGDTGILRGDIELANRGLCKLEINIESEVVKGDQVITSHLSSIYPPGIPIGTIEEIAQGKNGLTQYAYVKPIVDFKYLEQILVIESADD
ncbi:rod shape-determining protein MreC [Cellulosilyticum sp. I15G10I2]|uniref:rod shape-determining protein MreC n=1 Tax=Cellulosilyticum sp. I15G10I2 TaxID=1892843 RepID=UPI00085C0575|nr:rod shape-determining protein MreC [Cellulosilyticum sp. I15G10I2]